MVQEVIRNLTVPTPAMITLEDRVILLGSLLSLRDIGSLILVRNDNVLGAIYGYQLILLACQAPRGTIYKTLWKPIGELFETMPLETIPRVKQSEGFQSVLKQIVSKRFGDVLIVDNEDQAIGLLSLREIMTGLVEVCGRASITINAVASELKLISKNSTLQDAVNFMLRNRVRRAVINKDDKFYGITEREILRYMFSMHGLESMRDDPEGCLDVSLEKSMMGLWQELPKIDGSLDVAHGWRQAIKTSNMALIVDRKKIATPWDLVVKPYLEGGLRI